MRSTRSQWVVPVTRLHIIYSLFVCIHHHDNVQKQFRPTSRVFGKLYFYRVYRKNENIWHSSRGRIGVARTCIQIVTNCAEWTESTHHVPPRVVQIVYKYVYTYRVPIYIYIYTVGMSPRARDTLIFWWSNSGVGWWPYIQVYRYIYIGICTRRTFSRSPFPIIK